MRNAWEINFCIFVLGLYSQILIITLKYAQSLHEDIDLYSGKTIKHFVVILLPHKVLNFYDSIFIIKQVGK